MKKIVLTARCTFDLYNYRGDLITGLLKHGNEVICIAPFDDYLFKLQSLNVECYDITVEAKSNNPIKDILLTKKLHRLYKKINPDIIFHFTIKPNVYGTIAAYLGKFKSVAILTGLGYSFVQNNITARIARALLKFSLKLSSEVWVLNHDDKQELITRSILPPEKIFILPGEGLNLDFYPFSPKGREDKFTFLQIGRILGDKGINEIVEAGKYLKEQNLSAEIHLLGTAGFDSPDAFSLDDVQIWEKNGWIKYLGVTQDVRPFIAKSDCIILASYREGMSRTLMEATAMGKPIITTNVGGCKQFLANDNGFLIEPKSSSELISAIKSFMKLSQAEIVKMSINSRNLAERDHDIKKILEIYNSKIEEI